jgi:hypothetical protein
MNMEQWWNDIGRGKPKNSEKNQPQCHFVHHKSHMDWPRREPGLRGERPAINRLSHGTAIVLLLILQNKIFNMLPSNTFLTFQEEFFVLPSFIDFSP